MSYSLFNCKRIGKFFDKKVGCEHVEHIIDFDPLDLENDGNIKFGIVEDSPSYKYIEIENLGYIEKISLYQSSTFNYFF